MKRKRNVTKCSLLHLKNNAMFFECTINHTSNLGLLLWSTCTSLRCMPSALEVASRHIFAALPWLWLACDDTKTSSCLGHCWEVAMKKRRSGKKYSKKKDGAGQGRGCLLYQPDCINNTSFWLYEEVFVPFTDPNQ